MTQLEEAINVINEDKKNFSQTYDLVVTLHHINIDKTPISGETTLPKGRGREIVVGIITEENVSKAKELSSVVLTRQDIEKVDKKSAKKLASKCDSFVAETTLMALVGKNLGQVLGPRNKMPRPLPPGAPMEGIVKNLQKTVRIKAKKAPIIQVPVGTQDMSKEDVIENVNSVLEFIMHQLPRGKEQIKDVYLKATMTKPVRLTV